MLSTAGHHWKQEGSPGQLSPDVPEGWGFLPQKYKRIISCCLKAPSLCNLLWQTRTLMHATLLPTGERVHHEGGAFTKIMGMMLGRKDLDVTLEENEAASWYLCPLLVRMSLCG